jgi:hypothetical protein
MMTATHYDFAMLEGPVRMALQSWAEHVERVAGKEDQASIKTPK